MQSPREEHRAGLDYLEAITGLLRRCRSMHATKGLYEVGEVLWWWRSERPTDSLGQLFWFDDDGQPLAAVIITDWGNRVALDPIVTPDATPEWVGHIIERGLTHASESGFAAVELEVDRDDTALLDVLSRHGFTLKETGLVESWLAAEARPEVSELHDDYVLATRRDTTDRPHHMIGRSPADVAERLLQTPLYRPDLDLFIIDASNAPAAYGLFWFDPELAIGVVEPMRTEEAHQKRGLARHILTSGLDRLAAAGAERIKIVFDPGNAAASGLYLDVGFIPVKQTDTYAGSVQPVP